MALSAGAAWPAGGERGQQHGEGVSREESVSTPLGAARSAGREGGGRAAASTQARTAQCRRALPCGAGAGTGYSAGAGIHGTAHPLAARRQARGRARRSRPLFGGRRRGPGRRRGGRIAEKSRARLTGVAAHGHLDHTKHLGGKPSKAVCVCIGGEGVPDTWGWYTFRCGVVLELEGNPRHISVWGWGHVRRHQRAEVILTCDS